MLKKIICMAVALCFSATMLIPVRAQASASLNLPAAGTMVNLSPAYQPVIIKGLTVHQDNPFLFDFIVDPGQDQVHGDQLNGQGQRLIKYFLAALAIPDKEVWVNLSPYEKNKMVPEVLGQTEMGRDLLEEDYILKQLTASLIYPEKALGKKFWDRVYAKARQMYGTTQIPVNTFNKVWIMADRAEVFERNQTAFVVDQHLKVMLEEDYLALTKHQSPAAHSLASNIVGQIILPEIEKEVNTGKNFSTLRQIFNSIILANWYKNNLKQALLNQVYANHSKVQGINLNDPTVKEKIYEQYLKAYKKGVFNYIKEETGTNGQTIPRKYFSGGMREGAAVNPAMTTDAAVLVRSLPDHALMSISVGLETKPGGIAEMTDQAMLTVRSNPLYQDYENRLKNAGIKGKMLKKFTELNLMLAALFMSISDVKKNLDNLLTFADAIEKGVVRKDVPLYPDFTQDYYNSTRYAERYIQDRNLRDLFPVNTLYGTGPEVRFTESLCEIFRKSAFNRGGLERLAAENIFDLKKFYGLIAASDLPTIIKKIGIIAVVLNFEHRVSLGKNLDIDLILNNVDSTQEATEWLKKRYTESEVAGQFSKIIQRYKLANVLPPKVLMELVALNGRQVLTELEGLIEHGDVHDQPSFESVAKRMQIRLPSNASVQGSAVPNAILGKSVYDFGFRFTVKMKKAFQALGISTMGDFIKHTEYEFLQIKGFGPAARTRLYDFLYSHGLKLLSDRQQLVNNIRRAAAYYQTRSSEIASKLSAKAEEIEHSKDVPKNGTEEARRLYLGMLYYGHDLGDLRRYVYGDARPPNDFAMSIQAGVNTDFNSDIAMTIQLVGGGYINWDPVKQQILSTFGKPFEVNPAFKNHVLNEYHDKGAADKFQRMKLDGLESWLQTQVQKYPREEIFQTLEEHHNELLLDNNKRSSYLQAMLDLLENDSFFQWRSFETHIAFLNQDLDFFYWRAFVYELMRRSGINNLEQAGIASDWAMEASEVDKASTVQPPGGIDLTTRGMKWNVSRDGEGVEMHIDQAMLRRIQHEGIQWLSPVILKIRPVTDVWSLVGVTAPAGNGA